MLGFMGLHFLVGGEHGLVVESGGVAGGIGVGLGCH